MLMICIIREVKIFNIDLVIYRELHESQITKLIDSGAQVIGGGLFPYSGAYYIINCNDEEPIK